jgi:ubiquinone/menaquinone biosynthesis C-methylase UbiE
MHPPLVPERSRQVAALFDRVAETYDSVGVPWFTPIARQLVDELAPAAGESALDIGCGRGAALWPLADAVGGEGRVTGIDLSTEMVRATGADLAATGLGHVTLKVMDASDPDLEPASFDVIASSLVLFFLPDPAAALRSWWQLLAPGGRLGISTFGPRDQLWTDIDKLFVPYLPQQLLDARTSGTAGPFSSDAGMAALLGAAGFDTTRTVGISQPVSFSDVGEWHAWARSHGERAMWDAVGDNAEAIRSRAAELLAAGRGPDGRTVLTQQVRLSLAVRPKE